jgi:hypothetical protein
MEYTDDLIRSLARLTGLDTSDVYNTLVELGYSQSEAEANKQDTADTIKAFFPDA